jgi:hypothetical protein
MHKKILFIVKKGMGYSDTCYADCYSYSYNSSGLLNSASFVAHMLWEHGISAKLVVVNDNNDIDREVHNFNPDVVVIEALWVVPEKFEILQTLHPNVQWVVRIHSDIPFLALEGISVRWISEYVKSPNVFVGFNKKQTLESFVHLVPREKLLYLPNYFPLHVNGVYGERDSCLLNVGSFGAIRPLKNQLIQAMAAMRYATENGLTLMFHINATRVEGGASVLRNLRALFKGSGHNLVEHTWYSHEAFQYTLSQMDLSMCVSFSETFCIVAADSVALGVPIVCSSELPWASNGSIVDTTDMFSITQGIQRVLSFKWYHTLMNTFGLKQYDKQSVKVWKNFLKA